MKEIFIYITFSVILFVLAISVSYKLRPRLVENGWLPKYQDPSPMKASDCVQVVLIALCAPASILIVVTAIYMTVFQKR